MPDATARVIAGEGRALILPPLRRTAIDAARFATIVHEGQLDKAGRPYVGHLARVAVGVLRIADRCPFWSHEERDEAVQIAWLHDVVEDTPHGTKGLALERFSAKVIRGVEMLSKPKRSSQPYAEWVAWLAENAPLPTILVKLADVEDNSDPERLTLLPEADQARLTRKYAGAADMLREAARRKGWQG